MQERTWSVAELTGDVGRLVGAAFPGQIWLRGQIRSLSRHRSGHVYFDLVEPTPEGRQANALVKVVLFSDDRSQVNITLKEVGAVRMADGIEVRIRGAVQFFGRQGRLQVRMTGIDPAYTLGRLAEDRERLMTILRRDGLVDRNRTVALGRVPMRVGVVTSVGSAAWHDVIQELEGSGLAFTVVAADARTQGPTAAGSVAAALRKVTAGGVDVVLLVRGGGSRTDLAPFDSEIIARAVAASPAPVFTGIGHEQDSSVADLVAHTFCKTPTACAAAVVDQVRSFIQAAEGVWEGIRRCTVHRLDAADERLAQASRRMARSTPQILQGHEGRLDLAAHRLGRDAERIIERAEARLATSAARAHAHDPAIAMARGWSITRNDDGQLIRRRDQVRPGDRLVTTVADGEIASVATITRASADADTTDQPL